MIVVAEIKELWQTAKVLVGEEELTRRFRSWASNLIRTARVKQQNSDSGAIYDKDCAAVLADLNERTKSRFRPTDQAKHMIIRLLKQGYLVQDFIRVHEVKCVQWLGDDKMTPFLRPTTLYRQSHFDEYLGEWHRMDTLRREAAERRKRNVERSQSPELIAAKEKQKIVVQIEREGKVSKLSGKRWNEHESWLAFMLWTVQFPDAQSLQAYAMPARLREMRSAPGMLKEVAMKKKVDWAEQEYQKAKREAKNGKDV